MNYSIPSPSLRRPRETRACPACKSSSIVTASKKPDADSYWRCTRGQEKCGTRLDRTGTRRDPSCTVGIDDDRAAGPQFPVNCVT